MVLYWFSVIFGCWICNIDYMYIIDFIRLVISRCLGLNVGKLLMFSVCVNVVSV